MALDRLGSALAEPTTPTLPSELPVLPLRRTVAFPLTLQPLAVNRPVSIETAEGIWDGISHFTTVLPSHFETMGIPILSGRYLDSDDRSDSQPVIVVSQALAQRRWPEEDPLGRRIRLDLPGDSVWRTVVGVVGDVRYRLNFDPHLMFYVPFSQRPTPLRNWTGRSRWE